MFMNTVLLGPFRIMLVLLFVVLIYQMMVRHELKRYNLDYVMSRGIIAGSAVMTTLFFLIMGKVYDRFSIFIFFLIFIIGLYIHVFPVCNLKTMLAIKKKTLFSIINRVNKTNFNSISFFSALLRSIKPKLFNYPLFAAVFVSFVCLFSRYQFLGNDLYVLSNVWLNKLELVKLINENQWFGSDLIMPGEQALINLYAKTINISEEMALHSFGLLEVFGLSMVLFWFVGKLSRSTFYIPFISLLFFGFFYGVLPMNINLLLENNPVHLALFFAFPSMLFTLYPKLLTENKKRFFLYLCLVYSSIAIINLFVFIWLIPIFLVFAGIVREKQKVIHWVLSATAFSLVGLVVLAIYFIRCYTIKRPFVSFFKENLIRTDMYSYFPQLDIPLESLLKIYSSLGILLMLLIIPIYIIKGKQWRPVLVILLLFNAFINLRFIPSNWIDMDMFYQALTPMIIICIGMGLGVLNFFLGYIWSYSKRFKYGTILIASTFLLVIALQNKVFALEGLKEKEPLKDVIISVYDELSKEYLPFTYAVVNSNYAVQISKSNHRYMEYDFFVTDYLQKDAHYHKVKDDLAYLKKHPEVVLPNTIFVFVAQVPLHKESSSLDTPTKYVKAIKNSIEILKSRGRKVEIFHEADNLKVFKITNEDKASKIVELIFTL